MRWISELNHWPGTIVSAASESINVYPMDGLLSNLVLVTSFRHPWIPLWRESGIRVFCLEEQDSDPGDVTRTLLEHPETLRFLNTLEKPVRLLLFKPMNEIEQKLRPMGIHFLNAPAAVSRRLENKVLFPRLAEQAGIPVIPHIIVPLSRRMNTDDVFRELGLPLICQFAKGFSGNRTFLIRDTREMQVILDRFDGRLSKLSSFLEGQTWTANGCIGPSGDIRCSRPFYQITSLIAGEDGFPPTMGSRGNLWSRLDADRETVIVTMMRKMGNVLFGNGFQGMFGMDFQLSSGDHGIRAVEVNPRLIASLPVLTPLEIASHGTPLLVRHLLTFGESQWGSDPEYPPIPAGGQVIFRHPVPGEFLTWLSPMKPGIYRMADDQLEYMKPGWSASALEPETCLIWPAHQRAESKDIIRIIFRSVRFAPAQSIMSEFEHLIRRTFRISF